MNGEITITDESEVCRTGICSSQFYSGEIFQMQQMCLMTQDRYLGELNVGFDQKKGQGSACGTSPQISSNVSLSIESEEDSFCLIDVDAKENFSILCNNSSEMYLIVDNQI
jgi:hypothetical protein